ncbi:hypothetical protein [Alkaliphilus transvaalensis]|uniref:hypothetical protein n=1 Tax=Alkaliphilus transvaalensis TaxID=114628 RepID=UPI00047BADCF|nr:hypothetical protein [Alkaliphilus transvaalensis]
MKILYLSDLDKHGHHVYEFSYNANYDKHWNANSLYVDDNDFSNSLREEADFFWIQGVFEIA